MSLLLQPPTLKASLEEKLGPSQPSADLGQKQIANRLPHGHQGETELLSGTPPGDAARDFAQVEMAAGIDTCSVPSPGGPESGHMSEDARYMMAWLSFVAPAVGLTVPACLPRHLLGQRDCEVQSTIRCTQPESHGTM